MKVLIVDDEALAREVLETYLNRMPELQGVASCSNAVQAFEVLKSQTIDLMFLDIQMPQISGIDFLKSLSNPPKVIFTTAFPNYALEGYELNVVDYLLKPISFERFTKAVHKAMDLLHHLQSRDLPAMYHLSPPSEPSETEQSKEEDFIFVKADKKLIKIRFEDIYHIEGLKDYVIIHTPKGRIITLQTMKMLETKLPEDRFRRIHRSHIANLQHIEQVEGSNLLIKGKSLPLGKNYKDELLKIIHKNRL